MSFQFWSWIHLTEDIFGDADLGLVAEGQRLAESVEGEVLTVIMTGPETQIPTTQIETYGIGKILHLRCPQITHYHGELFANILFKLVAENPPCAILFADSPQSADLIGRLGALMEATVITHAVDASVDKKGRVCAVRPKANGYLYEELEATGFGSTLISFIPSVLTPQESGRIADIEIQNLALEVDLSELKTQTVETIEADPDDLNLEEADIIVSGGRGVGKGQAFDIIHELAHAIGATVGGTRPVIDSQILPFDRQIGQTGKTVAPRLLFNCGISGANEYTAGIEKSHQVIAINSDPRARIFRFADLSVIGDLHKLVPLLTKRLKDRGEKK